MAAPFDWSRISLHDNSVVEVRFIPNLAELVVIMEDAIEGGSGAHALRLLGVRSISVSGSTTGGVSGFTVGDEVLSVDIHTLQDKGNSTPLLQVRFLLNPLTRVVKPATGLNVLEIVAVSVELAD